MLGAREGEREYQNIPVAANRNIAKTKNSLSKCLFKGSSRDDLPSSDNSRVLPSHGEVRDAAEYRLLCFSFLEDRCQQVDYSVECGSAVPEVLD